jgi:hypothetical protein
VLKQDIAWYDTTTTNDFASRMTDDLNKLQAGLEKTRVFKKKPAQWVFFLVFFWVFGVLVLFVHKKSVSKRKVCIIFIKKLKI